MVLEEHVNVDAECPNFDQFNRVDVSSYEWQKKLDGIGNVLNASSICN
ncbi:hypothetical protein EYZ11_003082 [Aspergillus tanneri]|uniref:Uncharacterized protein n=1 Tax=Aspergillus tanneri TaxID=1220188 RepID=A0A4S3JP32_9EURO|nr:hypothetical protein EYZ11_003082 [Aspergillus tanneri]